MLEGQLDIRTSYKLYFYKTESITPLKLSLHLNSVCFPSFCVFGAIHVTDAVARPIREAPHFKNLTIKTLLEIDEVAGHILDESGWGEINLQIENSTEKALTFKVSRMVKRQSPT